LVERIKTLATKKKCTAAQLALGWVLAQGEDIVPIPGTKRRKYLEENVAALNIELTPADLEEISAATPPGAAAGMRYPEAGMQSVNR
jgi:aryl-alcohol dehydrogenase-like predicted oxidoreductase